MCGREQPVVLIPAFEPDERLASLTKQLAELGLKHIVVVDDGNGAACAELFERIEKGTFEDTIFGKSGSADGEVVGICHVLHHGRNMGKGAALKTGLAYIEGAFPDAPGVVTADADGQHCAEDIKKIADALEASSGNELILGVRDFSSDNVPLRSLFGNKMTSWIFYLLFHIKCPDTQTGLRGIPGTMLQMALQTEGERFEYEMNMLENAVRQYALSFIPITTVYENQQKQKSHFRPVRDSIRIYGRFIRYSMSSLLCALLDLGLFALFAAIFQERHVMPVPTATCCARILSGCLNYTLNRKWSFKSRMPVRREMFRYGVLFAVIMICSAAGTCAMNYFIPNAVMAKAIVDTALFFLSFYVQRTWVYRS